MAEAPPLDTGAVVGGRYRLETLVGRGGMGEVWTATQLDLPRTVALKVLHSADSPDANEREALFLRGDARAAGRIRHPNVVKVFEVGRDEAVGLFLAMEYIAGHPLDKVALMLAPHEAVSVVMQVLGALEAAHREGILHRDIKPGNVIVQSVPGHGNFVTVVDFGIARAIGPGDDGVEEITEMGVCRGTPTYLAPEQALGEELDARADVYAAATVLYQLLVGDPPFVRGAQETQVHYLLRKTQDDPNIPHRLANGRPFPQELAAVLARGLARDRNNRPVTAEELRRDLEPWARAEAWGRLGERPRPPATPGKGTADVHADPPAGRTSPGDPPQVPAPGVSAPIAPGVSPRGPAPDAFVPSAPGAPPRVPAPDVFVPSARGPSPADHSARPPPTSAPAAPPAVPVAPPPARHPPAPPPIPVSATRGGSETEFLHALATASPEEQAPVPWLPRGGAVPALAPPADPDPAAPAPWLPRPVVGGPGPTPDAPLSTPNPSPSPAFAPPRPTVSTSASERAAHHAPVPGAPRPASPTQVFAAAVPLAVQPSRPLAREVETLPPEAAWSGPRRPRESPAEPETDWMLRAVLYGVGAGATLGWATLFAGAHREIARAVEAAATPDGARPARPPAAWANGAVDALPAAWVEGLLAWPFVAWGLLLAGLGVAVAVEVRRRRFPFPIGVAVVGFVWFLLWLSAEAQRRLG